MSETVKRDPRIPRKPLAHPFGYHIVEGRLVEDESEQKVLSLAREMRERGMTLEYICHDLQGRGFLNRWDRPYTKQALFHILRRAGIQRVQHGSGKRISTDVPKHYSKALRVMAKQRHVTVAQLLREMVMHMVDMTQEQQA